MKQPTPSQQLAVINPDMTKMIRIEGSYMYSNPSIDVVIDKHGNFYSNKKGDGYKLLNGKKVHYVLNANGQIIKGNTTKTSLMRTLFGSTMPEFKLDVVEQVKPTQAESNKMVGRNKPNAKTNQDKMSINIVKNKIEDHIKSVELHLSSLKQLLSLHL